MSHLEPEHTDVELDSLLRRSSPAPDPGWIAELEHRLLPAARRKAAPWRLPHVRMGAALAAGFAALLIALSLAGVGPLGGGAPDVRAKDNCTVIRVSRIERVPVVVEGPSGESVVYRRELVQRWERRCR